MRHIPSSAAGAVGAVRMRTIRCVRPRRRYTPMRRTWVSTTVHRRICKLAGVWNGCARVSSGGWPFPPDWVGTSIDIGWNDQMNKKSMASMPTPAETVVFSDAAYFLSCGGTRTVYANACAACNPSLRTRNNTRHVEGENLVFADGHAKWMNHREIADKCGKLFWPMRDHDNVTYWSKWGGGPAD